MEKQKARWYERLRLGDPIGLRKERTVRSLLQIFASFISSEHRAAPQVLKTVFDFARDLFPEIDHGVIGRLLESSVANLQPTAPALRQLKRALSPQYRAAFALQLNSIVRTLGNSPEAQKRFLYVMESLGDLPLGEIAQAELASVTAPKSDQLSRVDFGVGPAHQVRLPNTSKAVSFRCYQAGALILVRNLSTEALWIRGHALASDQLMQIRPSDEIIAGSWRLSHLDLAAFLSITDRDAVPEVYLRRDEEKLSLNRSKSRQQLARLTFGHRVRLVPSEEETLFDPDGSTLLKGAIYYRDYFETIRVKDDDPVTMDSLRKLSLRSGEGLLLSSRRRKVRVTNDPGSLTGDSLLLTPGLAPRFVIDLEFVIESGEGKIWVREAAHPITVNGTTIDDGRVGNGTLLKFNDRQALRCRFTENILDEERSLVRRLEIENLNHSFRKGVPAIDSLSFQIAQGEMLCIIGPSGSGKSTLLEILAGQRKPKSGHVRLEGLSLYERPQALSPLISFMPQEEALSSRLTPREHLVHACGIRRPHLQRRNIHKRVAHLLNGLGLERAADRRTGSPDSKSLSGGERSRLNAGLDLIGGGEIFLFDEPISGLSSKDAENVVTGLHGLAHDKIIIASLHRPSEKVLAEFDLVLLLDRGGKMAFYGTPSELLRYFKEASRDLGIEQSSPSGNRGADFVFDVLEEPLVRLDALTRAERRFPPEFWQERFEHHRVMEHISLASESQTALREETPLPPPAADAPKPPKHDRRQKFNIFRIHLSRAAKSKLRHKGSLYSVLLEAPLLALLIAQTLRASSEGSYAFHSGLHLASYLFLAVTVAMFFGLTNSATEVLRDRPLLRRERNCRPHPILYLLAKYLVLMVLLTLQSVTFITAAHALLEIQGMFWIHLSWMLLSGSCGTALALLISVVARSERSALGAIPLILVPQILLAGALIPFSEMNRGLFIGGESGREVGAEPVPSVIMPLRYAFEGAVVSQATQNPFENKRIPLQLKIDALKEQKTLSKPAAQELRHLRDTLNILYVAETETPPEARQILQNPQKALEPLHRDQTNPDETRPIFEFFVNEKIEGLVDLAESTRLDDRNSKPPLVFLATQKEALGLSIATSSYCRLILAALTLTLLALATASLRRSLNRR